MSFLLYAAQAGLASEAPTFPRKGCGYYTLDLLKDTAPSHIQVALNKIDGFTTPVAGYLVALCSPLRVRFARPPSANLDVVVCITELGWGKDASGSFKSTFYADLAKHTDRVPIIIRSTNTAVDLFDVECTFPPGVSESLLGILSGFRQPALSVAFSRTGSVAECTSHIYIDAVITCGGHGYRA